MECLCNLRLSEHPSICHLYKTWSSIGLLLWRVIHANDRNHRRSSPESNWYPFGCHHLSRDPNGSFVGVTSFRSMNPRLLFVDRDSSTTTKQTSWYCNHNHILIQGCRSTVIPCLDPRWIMTYMLNVCSTYRYYIIKYKYIFIASDKSCIFHCQIFRNKFTVAGPGMYVDHDFLYPLDIKMTCHFCWDSPNDLTRIPHHKPLQ